MSLKNQELGSPLKRWDALRTELGALEPVELNPALRRELEDLKAKIFSIERDVLATQSEEAALHQEEIELNEAELNEDILRRLEELEARSTLLIAKKELVTAQKEALQTTKIEAGELESRLKGVERAYRYREDLQRDEERWAAAAELAFKLLKAEGFELDTSTPQAVEAALDQLEKLVAQMRITNAKDLPQWEARLRNIVETLSREFTRIREEDRKMEQKAIRAERGLERFPDWEKKGVTLYENQIEGAFGYVEWLKGGKRRRMGRLVSPMGSGKTLTAAVLSTLGGGKTVFFAWNRGQAENTERETAAFYEKAGIGKTVGAYNDRRKNVSADFIVSYFAANRQLFPEIDWSDVDVIFVDEADVNGLSDARLALLRGLADKHEIPVIALTATEEQASGKTLEEGYPDEILHLPLPAGLLKMRALGITSDMSFEDRYVDAPLSITVADILKGQEVNPEELDEWIKQGGLLDFILNDYLERFTGQRAAVIFRNNHFLDALCRRARERGLRIERLTGKEDEGQMESIRGTLLNHELDMVVGSRMLERGTDLPLEVVYGVPTYSPQVFWQSFGRGMRKDPKNPNKVARLVNVAPRVIVDRKSGRALQPEERPLSFQTFMDLDYYAGAENPNARELKLPVDFSASIGNVNHIRSTREVKGAIAKYRSKPIDFLGRPAVLAAAMRALSDDEPLTRTHLYGLKSVTRGKRPLRKSAETAKDWGDRAGLVAELEEKENGKSSRTARNFAEYMGAAGNTVTDHLRDLTYGEEQACLEAYLENNDPEALRRLLLSHEPLLRAMAEKLAKSPQDVEDLVQEGSLSLMLQIRSYSVGKRATRLIHFAIKSIFENMRRNAWRLYTSEGPQHTLDEQSRLLELERVVEVQGQYQTTRNLIAAAIGKTERVNILRARRQLPKTKRWILNTKKIEQLRILRQGPASLDGLAAAPSIYEDIDPTGLNIQQLIGALKSSTGGRPDVLSDRQWYVLDRRFGLDLDESMTLDQIGKEMDLTRESVRQIEFEARRRVRDEFFREPVEEEAPVSWQPPVHSSKVIDAGVYWDWAKDEKVPATQRLQMAKEMYDRYRISLNTIGEKIDALKAEVAKERRIGDVPEMLNKSIEQLTDYREVLPTLLKKAMSVIREIEEKVGTSNEERMRFEEE